jgi:hypothetical protein
MIRKTWIALAVGLALASCTTDGGTPGGEENPPAADVEEAAAPEADDPGEEPADDPGDDPGEDAAPIDSQDDPGNPGEEATNEVPVAPDAAELSPVGGPCKKSADCAGGEGKGCLPATYLDGSAGWPGGYCTVFGCETGSCPEGSECFQMSDGAGGVETLCLAACTKKADCNAGYACPEFGACVPACTSDADCGDGEECTPDGTCETKPCTAGSCGAGYKCESGTCVPDVSGGPGPGPGPDCPGLPAKDCEGTAAFCGEVIAFEPLTGPGYDNYPLNGECSPCPAGQGCDGNWSCTASGKLKSQYRSYARRDLVMLVKWATAFVACKAASWAGGNGAPLGLGDMSEANGAIPGTSIGEPGHPKGTHEMGFDIDIAYYQNAGTDNHLRPICEHTEGGQEVYHCVKAPTILDLWRHTLFTGALLTSTRVRVIGADGKVGPLVEAAMPTLCASGWLPQTACDKVAYKLAYEETDTGMGWFYFHHHHTHVSLSDPNRGAFAPAAMPCITQGCPATHAGSTPSGAFDLRPSVPLVRLHVPAVPVP